MMKKLSILLMWFVAQIAVAQTDYTIEEVQIISLSTPIDVEKSGRSVTVVSANELQKLPVSTVEEALRYVAGVNINSRGGFGVQSDIGMRGSTFSQVLFLIDGVRWNEPLTAHFNNTIPVPLSEIDRIEVLRGAASAMFGADAVGGVIHIQTKTFNNNEAKGLSTSGQLLLGENRLNDQDIAARYQLDKLTVSAGFKATNSEGEELANPNFMQVPTPTNENFNTAFDIKNFTAAANYQPTNDWQINARYAQDDRDFDAKYFYTASAYDESVEEIDTYLGQISVQKQHANNNQTSVALSYKKTTDYFNFNPVFTPNDHTTKRFNGVLTHGFAVGKTKFNVGTQYDAADIESTDRGDHNQNNLEVFATSFIDLSEDVSTILSLRGGSHSDYDFSISPQASIAYHKNRYVVRASVGSAVRGSDFTEKYVSSEIPSLSPGRNVGNPFLDTEKSITADLGVDWLATPNTQINASTFYRTSDDLIDYVLTNADLIDYANNLTPGENYYQLQNIGESNTFGIELGANTKAKIENGALTAALNYTLLSTDIKDGIDSKYLSNHPNHQLNLLGGIQYGKIGLSTAFQFIDRDEEAIPTINGGIEDSYTIFNLKANVDVANEFQVIARVQNLFDTEYQEILGSPMPSRWISAGFQWNMNK